MVGSTVSEDSLAEQPALRWLCGDAAEVAGVGWDYLHGTALAPDAPTGERARWSDVVLRGRLERAMRRISPHLPAEAVERA